MRIWTLWVLVCSTLATMVLSSVARQLSTARRNGIPLCAVLRLDMTRSQLIARLAKKRESLSHADVEAAVKTMLEHLAAHLAGAGRIEIRDFGGFSLRPRRSRLGRNPRTGAPVARPAGYGVHFRPGRALRRRVRVCREANSGDEAQGLTACTPAK